MFHSVRGHFTAGNKNFTARFPTKEGPSDFSCLETSFGKHRGNCARKTVVYSPRLRRQWGFCPTLHYLQGVGLRTWQRPIQDRLQSCHACQLAHRVRAVNSQASLPEAKPPTSLTGVPKYLQIFLYAISCVLLHFCRVNTIELTNYYSRLRITFIIFDQNINFF